PTLPIKEPLLADRPEHLFERPDSEKLPEGNPWGFKMDVPEFLYNRGELHNLSIQRGTLTPEDRYKINEHIVQTIKMLDKLPFPKHLKSVPELAGGHHEKMDGTGYPKRLTRDDMSPVSRMMAVADIFEALTAVDRPYKKGKKLSEAIKIMSSMVTNQHIDPDIFRLFLESKAYLAYAQEYMNPDQIDDVPIADYLS
ncbi:HD-GYP domain-containing protein, partial [Marinomonas sp.]|uniref:HD-GYP domain-containing protein n=1 Tax=Marinomonas sp. TaxID=1904862 RepID=UPI003C70CCF5